MMNRPKSVKPEIDTRAALMELVAGFVQHWPRLSAEITDDMEAIRVVSEDGSEYAIRIERTQTS